MRGVYITAIIMTIVMIWILLVSYKYAYKRKWGNEESSVDPLPETDGDSHHSASSDAAPSDGNAGSASNRRNV